MNKIEELLSKLPEGYKEKALHYHKTIPLGIVAKNQYTKANAVNWGFEWGLTDEGEWFWECVHETLYSNKPLPSYEELKTKYENKTN